MRLIVVCVIALVLIAAPAGAQVGSLDRSFGQSGRASIAPPGQSAHARGIAVQPDGKIVVIGTGRRGWTVSRLAPGGRLDRTFGTRGRVVIASRSAGAEPLALALLPDGRIVVGGSLEGNGATATAQVARLLPDGRLDPSFGDGGRVTLGALGRIFFGGLALLPDGGLAVTGTVHERDQRLTVWRLRPDGSLDAGFAHGGTFVDPQPGTGVAIAARPDGRLLVGGETGTYYTFSGARELVLALTADGRVDTSWGRDGRFVGPGGSQVRSLLLAPDGGAVALDWLPSQASVLWLTPDGGRRETWGLDGRAPLGERTTPAFYTRAIALDAAGRVYAAGAAFYRRLGEPQELAAVTRVAESGMLDRNFGRAGTARIAATKRTRRSVGEAIALGPGERVYLAASGSSELQDIREDFGYTHALVSRLRGWHPFAGIGDTNAFPRRRWTLVEVGCTRSCRASLTISDARGRRLGRTARSVRSGRPRSFRVRLSRRLRRGERITLRLRARDRTDRVDDVVERVRVKRPT